VHDAPSYHAIGTTGPSNRGVLLPAADSTSSIKCFSGTVDSSLTQMAGMPGMAGMNP